MKNKLVIYIKCCIALTLCLLPVNVAAKTHGAEQNTAESKQMTNAAHNDNKQFVTVRDGRFYIGDSEYRYIGTNFWYGAILGSTGQGGNRERLHRELDDMKAVGVENVRILVGGDGRDSIPSHIAPKLQVQPGVYNDTLLVGLDYVMAELEKRNMKAILYFNNAWEWSGGYGAYLDWVGFSAEVESSDGSGKKKFFKQNKIMKKQQTIQ